MVKPTVILFDIDGTLLLSGGAGRRAMERACGEILGMPDACASFSMAGMTDRAIVRRACQAAGRPDHPALLDQLLEAYLCALPEELARSTRFRILAGGHRLIAALREHGHVAVGLGTGNVRRGAAHKLGHAGLWNVTHFGGFGCDAEDRGELIRIGAERGARSLGRPLGECRVVVVGDTLFDVRAAAVNGFVSLAIATGATSREELSAGGADWAVGSLEEPGILEFLLG
ncbi:MAG: haloacid dehalogenase-like hydrolase [Deltaproteobacteria bacterium]|nr:haloacid dehalogenase-like hydrolase [Deltaproteobacteria bacterium]